MISVAWAQTLSHGWKDAECAITRHWRTEHSQVEGERLSAQRVSGPSHSERPRAALHELHEDSLPSY